MRPSPHDVIRALDSLKPGAGALVTGAHRNAYPASLRRVCVAVCYALGWGPVRIARAVNRDHSTVRQCREMYLRNRELGGREEEAELFRAVMLRAHEIAFQRANMVARLWGSEGRAA